MNAELMCVRVCVVIGVAVFGQCFVCAHTKPDSLSAAQSVALEGEREREREVETGGREGACSDE